MWLLCSKLSQFLCILLYICLEVCMYVSTINCQYSCFTCLVLSILNRTHAFYAHSETETTFVCSLIKKKLSHFLHDSSALARTRQLITSFPIGCISCRPSIEHMHIPAYVCFPINFICPSWRETLSARATSIVYWFYV